VLVSGTTVASGRVGLIVTVRVPAFPLGRVRLPGLRAVTVGASWLTVIVLWAWVPLRGPAVRVAVPGVIPVTGTKVARVPAGTVTLAATLAVPGALLARGITVSVACHEGS
jgi:hypothetical protein